MSYRVIREKLSDDAENNTAVASACSNNNNSKSNGNLTRRNMTKYYKGATRELSLKFCQ